MDHEFIALACMLPCSMRVYAAWFACGLKHGWIAMIEYFELVYDGSWWIFQYLQEEEEVQEEVIAVEERTEVHMAPPIPDSRFNDSSPPEVIIANLSHYQLGLLPSIWKMTPEVGLIMYDHCFVYFLARWTNTPAYGSFWLRAGLREAPCCHEGIWWGCNSLTLLPLSRNQSWVDCCFLLVGTDEAAIINVMGHRSKEQIQEIILMYKQMFGKVSIFLLLFLVSLAMFLYDFVLLFHSTGSD